MGLLVSSSADSIEDRSKDARLSMMYKIAIAKVAITQRTGISHTLDIHEAWIIPTFKTQQRPELLLSRMIFD